MKTQVKQMKRSRGSFLLRRDSRPFGQKSWIHRYKTVPVLLAFCISLLLELSPVPLLRSIYISETVYHLLTAFKLNTSLFLYIVISLCAIYTLLHTLLPFRLTALFSTIFVYAFLVEKLHGFDSRGYFLLAMMVVASENILAIAKTHQPLRMLCAAIGLFWFGFRVFKKSREPSSSFVPTVASTSSVGDVSESSITVQWNLKPTSSGQTSLPHAEWLLQKIPLFALYDRMLNAVTPPARPLDPVIDEVQKVIVELNGVNHAVLSLLRRKFVIMNLKPDFDYSIRILNLTRRGIIIPTEIMRVRTAPSAIMKRFTSNFPINKSSTGPSEIHSSTTLYLESRVSLLDSKVCNDYSVADSAVFCIEELDSRAAESGSDSAPPTSSPDVEQSARDSIPEDVLTAELLADRDFNQAVASPNLSEMISVRPDEIHMDMAAEESPSLTPVKPAYAYNGELELADVALSTTASEEDGQSRIAELRGLLRLKYGEFKSLQQKAEELSSRLSEQENLVSAHKIQISTLQSAMDLMDQADSNAGVKFEVEQKYFAKSKLYLQLENETQNVRMELNEVMKSKFDLLQEVSMIRRMLESRENSSTPETPASQSSSVFTDVEALSSSNISSPDSSKSPTKLLVRQSSDLFSLINRSKMTISSDVENATSQLMKSFSDNSTHPQQPESSSFSASSFFSRPTNVKPSPPITGLGFMFGDATNKVLIDLSKTFGISSNPLASAIIPPSKAILNTNLSSVSSTPHSTNADMTPKLGESTTAYSLLSKSSLQAEVVGDNTYNESAMSQSPSTFDIRPFVSFDLSRQPSEDNYDRQQDDCPKDRMNMECRVPSSFDMLFQSTPFSFPVSTFLSEVGLGTKEESAFAVSQDQNVMSESDLQNEEVHQSSVYPITVEELVSGSDDDLEYSAATFHDNKLSDGPDITTPLDSDAIPATFIPNPHATNTQNQLPYHFQAQSYLQQYYPYSNKPCQNPGSMPTNPQAITAWITPVPADFSPDPNFALSLPPSQYFDTTCNPPLFGKGSARTDETRVGNHSNDELDATMQSVAGIGIDEEKHHLNFDFGDEDLFNSYGLDYENGQGYHGYEQFLDFAAFSNILDSNSHHYGSRQAQTSHHKRPRSTSSSENYGVNYSDGFKTKPHVLSGKQFKQETRKSNFYNQQCGGSKDKKSQHNKGYNYLTGSHTYDRKQKYTNSHDTQRHKKKDDSTKLERNYTESRNGHSASRSETTQNRHRGRSGKIKTLHPSVNSNEVTSQDIMNIPLTEASYTPHDGSINGTKNGEQCGNGTTQRQRNWSRNYQQNRRPQKAVKSSNKERKISMNADKCTWTLGHHEHQEKKLEKKEAKEKHKLNKASFRSRPNKQPEDTTDERENINSAFGGLKSGKNISLEVSKVEQNEKKRKDSRIGVAV